MSPLAIGGTKQVERREWLCKKCGELRSNKETHIHGRPMNEPKAI